MFFNTYPYTDGHELNLDWILAKIRELQKEMNDFEVINNITFSGEWDITDQYPAWTIVTDNNIGYVSIQPVPAGVMLNNADYWRVVIDYTAQIAGLQNRVVNLENEFNDLENGFNDQKAYLLYANDLPDSLSVYNVEPGEDITSKLTGLFSELDNTKYYELNFPGEEYLVGGVTVPSNVRLMGHNTTMRASQVSGYMLGVSASISGIRFEGDNASGDVNSTATKNGLDITGAYFSIDKCKFIGLDTALNFANDNTCLLTIAECTFMYNELCVKGCTLSNTNSGERLSFVGCTFGSSRKILDSSSGVSDFTFSDCSLDYSDVLMVVNNAIVFINNCHIENILSIEDRWKSANNYLFKVENAGKLYLNNCNILLYGSLDTICDSPASDAAEFKAKNCTCWVSSQNAFINSEFEAWVSAGSSSLTIQTPFFSACSVYDTHFVFNWQNPFNSGNVVNSTAYSAGVFTISYTAADNGLISFAMA